MQISKNIKGEYSRRVFEESYSRIVKCVGMLTDDQLWLRPNDSLVSIANLILHLEGNIRQWIMTGVGNFPDHRKRDLEFSQTDRIDRKYLLSKLEDTIGETIEVVNQIQDDKWTELKNVQGYEESILSIVVHVIEHFSYHTGQITYYTKLLTNKDTNYYGDQDLNVTED